MTPDGAVQAAAKQVALGHGWDAEAWDSKLVPSKYRQSYFDIACAALEAAATYMLSHGSEETRPAHVDPVANQDAVDRLERERAEVWDIALQYADDMGYLREHQTDLLKRGNPYRGKR